MKRIDSNSTSDSSTMMKHIEIHNPNGENETLSRVTFEQLEFIAENNDTKQTAHLRIKDLSATDLDDPDLEMSMRLEPLLAGRQSGSGNDDFRLQLWASRDLSPSAPSPRSEIQLLLSHFRLCAVSKMATTTALSIRTRLHRAQKIAHRFSSFLLGEDKNKAIQIAEKSLEYLDIVWKLELGDCELQFFDIGRTVPVGVMKLANFEKDSLSQVSVDLEQQLIESKLELATTNSQRDHLNTQITDLTKQLGDLNKSIEQLKKKHAAEVQSLEQQLITAKISLVEAMTT